MKVLRGKLGGMVAVLGAHATLDPPQLEATCHSHRSPLAAMLPAHRSPTMRTATLFVAATTWALQINQRRPQRRLTIRMISDRRPPNAMELSLVLAVARRLGDRHPAVLTLAKAWPFENRDLASKIEIWCRWTRNQHSFEASSLDVWMQHERGFGHVDLERDAETK